jgi:hypothetical protein
MSLKSENKIFQKEENIKNDLSKIIVNNTNDTIIKNNYATKNIDSNVTNNTDQEKADNVKLADACFSLLGIEKDARCPHGLTFFQCMPCSH